MFFFFQNIFEMGKYIFLRFQAVVNVDSSIETQVLSCRAKDHKLTALIVSPVRWTRREEADFYRVVSTFGVVFDTNLQKFDWSQFRAFARLDKKTDESLEKYYYSFIAMCKRVCRMQANAETGIQAVVAHLAVEPMVTFTPDT